MYGGKFAFQIRLGQLVVGRKFTIFALFYFVFEGKFQVQAPPGGLYSEGRLNGGFFGLRFWGADIWRGLYMEGLIFGILRYAYIYRLNTKIRFNDTMFELYSRWVSLVRQLSRQSAVLRTLRMICREFEPLTDMKVYSYSLFQILYLFPLRSLDKNTLNHD